MLRRSPGPESAMRQTRGPLDDTLAARRTASLELGFNIGMPPLIIYG
jgi:hypothetical protein